MKYSKTFLEKHQDRQVGVEAAEKYLARTRKIDISWILIGIFWGFILGFTLGVIVSGSWLL